MAHPFWTLVLAGGRGSRLNELTGGVPKQFWSPDGSRTMVERTIERLNGMVPPSMTVTVLGPSQERFAHDLVRRDVLGHCLSQPVDRGTGVAALWGLATILARDPDAIVLITPADHGIESEIEYRDGIRVAVRAVATGLHRVVLFGTTPSRPAEDYGWIVPTPTGQAIDQRLFRSVLAFAEKPPREEAVRLMSCGALWNTMVLVGRADGLLGLFEDAHVSVAQEARRLVATRADEGTCARAFDHWPTIDFSRDILAGATDLTVYTWRPSLGWCDLGTAERVGEWQRAAGLGPVHVPPQSTPDRPLHAASLHRGPFIELPC